MFTLRKGYGLILVHPILTYVHDEWNIRNKAVTQFIRWPIDGKSGSFLNQKVHYTTTCHHHTHFDQQPADSDIVRMWNIVQIDNTLSVSRWRVRTCNDVLICKENIKNATLISEQQKAHVALLHHVWGILQVGNNKINTYNTYKMPPKLAIWLNNWESKRGCPSHRFIFTSNYLS